MNDNTSNHATTASPPTATAGWPPMNRMLSLLAVALIAACQAHSGEPTQPLPLAQAVAEGKATIVIAGDGRGSATMRISVKEPLLVSLAAGTVLTAENGERQVVLRTLQTQAAPGTETDAILPAAALSSKNTAAQRPLRIAPEPEPRLAPLLALFEKQNDLPRPTAQLAVFVLLEDMPWTAWRQWQDAAQRPPTPAEISQAVDAAAFVHLAAPDRKPALLTDETLKKFALRNPWARGKAMALYGLSVENAVTGDPSLPPDLNQLLHTAPNDNCPICRQRQKMTPELP